jgi:hypothetical protein
MTDESDSMMNIELLAYVLIRAHAPYIIYGFIKWQDYNNFIIKVDSVHTISSVHGYAQSDHLYYYSRVLFGYSLISKTFLSHFSKDELTSYYNHFS